MLSDVLHVHGFPAVARRYQDIQETPDVLLAHPHHAFPWTSGTIRHWAFYISQDLTDTSNISLQVWRPTSTQYSFVGETILHDLNQGYHIKELNEPDERIHFEAGDVIGVRFQGSNPIPYDMHPEPCRHDDNVHIIQIPSNERPNPGQLYPYTSRTVDREDCKMYSLVAGYIGSGNSYNHMYYNINLIK